MFICDSVILSKVFVNINSPEMQLFSTCCMQCVRKVATLQLFFFDNPLNIHVYIKASSGHFTAY